VVQHLVGSKTSEIVDRDRIVKGYEFERARYVTITDDDLKDLEVESSKIIDLDRFVDRDKVDPIYLEVPSYIYPDGELAAETFRVIGEAMAHKNKVGLGRVTIASRERPVLIDVSAVDLVMSTLRSANEVRPARFGAKAQGEVDTGVVAIAEAN
jgi:DNA end-binding protein Ku